MLLSGESFFGLKCREGWGNATTELRNPVLAWKEPLVESRTEINLEADREVWRIVTVLEHTVY